MEWILSFLFIEIVWTLLGAKVTSLFSLFPIPYVELHVNFITLFGILLLFIYRRVKVSFKEYVTNAPQFRYSLFFFSFGVWFVCMGLAAVTVALLFKGSITLNKRPSLIFVLIVLLLTPLQALSEELLFRTTLWRMLSHRGISAFSVTLISGLTFALAHLFNREVFSPSLNPIALSYYVVTGVLFMQMTLYFKGSEAAFGAHIANNLFIALIVNYSNSTLISDSLFIQNFSPIVIDFIVLSLSVTAIMVGGKKFKRGVD